LLFFAVSLCDLRVSVVSPAWAIFTTETPRVHRDTEKFEDAMNRFESIYDSRLTIHE